MDFKIEIKITDESYPFYQSYLQSIKPSPAIQQSIASLFLKLSQRMNNFKHYFDKGHTFYFNAIEVLINFCQSDKKVYYFQ